jgi:hypothetical protein
MSDWWQVGLKTELREFLCRLKAVRWTASEIKADANLRHSAAGALAQNSDQSALIRAARRESLRETVFL